MPTEKIKYSDNLKQGTDKLNSAIETANTAEILSTNADTKATQALSNSEQTQTELTQAILAGDSSPLGGQLSVGAEGTVYAGPQERLLAEYNGLTANLAETKTKVTSNLYVHNRKKKAVVTIIDDDGYSEVMTVLKPMVDALNLKVDIAMPTSFLDTTGRLTSAQLVSLYKEGFGVLSHSHTHPNLSTLTESQLDDEMRISKNILNNLGIDPVGIVFPFNARSRLVCQYSRQYYQLGIGKVYVANEDLNRSPVRSAQLTRRELGWGGSQALEGNTSALEGSLEQCQYYVDKAISEGSWLIFVTHTAQSNATERQAMADGMAYIASKRDAGLIDVLITEEAVKRFGNKYDDGTLFENTEFDDVYGVDDYNVIGTDGYKYSGREHITYKGNPGDPSSPSSSLPLSSYKKGITLTPFTGSHATGLPGVGGLLETFKTFNDVRSFQYWHSYNGHLYKRSWSGSAWGSLVKLSASEISIPSTTLTFPSVPANGEQTLTLNVPGATTSDTVIINPRSQLNANFTYNAGIYSPDTVSVTVHNLRNVAASPGERNWVGKVLKA